MARVKQYPHFLFIEKPGASVQDANGDWTESTIQRVLLSPCREEKDGRGQEYDTGGGTFIKCTSVLQCPKSCPNVAKGTRVIVSNDAECTDVRIAGVVLNCEPSQMHTRIWV